VKALSLGVALLAGLAAGGAEAKDMPPANPPFAGMACEAHVWALGRPNFQPKSNMLVRFTPPSAADLANPYSTANVFSALRRAQALSDVQITALFPGAASVKVVTHDTMVDLDQTPFATIKAPLAPHQGQCYADLGITNLYAIFPNPDAPYVQFGLVGGMLASAIAGSDRLVIEFWLQQWPGDRKGGPFVLRRRNDSPLPHVQPATPQMLDAARASADLNLSGFVALANARRKP
jgi:hypothetical protein